MNRDKAIETIVRAVQWLTSRPEAHSTGVAGYTHAVKVSARTSDLRTGSRGIYFGSSDRTPIALVNHADRESFLDYIPVTAAPKANEPRLGVYDCWGVDMRILRSFSNEQLARMASNALRVMSEYDVS